MTLPGRLLGGLLGTALSLAGLAIYVALQPLGPVIGLALCAAMCGLMLSHRLAWLVIVPGLLPVIDLANWTGRIHVTESDALVLCAVLAASIRPLIERKADAVDTQAATLRLGALAWLLILLMSISYIVSTDWSGLKTALIDPLLLVGYATPLNGPRLAKGFFLSVLLLPLLHQAFRGDPAQATRYTVVGLLMGLVLVSLATVWERWAFVGLLDFASDYRTTALFWEANVGGAMLDGWLAITVPFAVWVALRARDVRRATLSLTLLALTGYAVFTTFSRGLYIGVVLGCGLMLVLMAWHARRETTWRPGLRELLLIVPAVVILAILANDIFEVGGYRGLAALMGLVFAVYLTGPVAALLSKRGWLAAIVTTAFASAVSVLAMLYVPKGVYLAYGLSMLAVVALLWGDVARHARIDAAPLAIGAVLWVAVNAALVTGYWSEGDGSATAAWSSTIALVPLVLVRCWSSLCWRPTVAASVRVIMGLGVLLAGVMVTGSYYAGERFSTIERDLAGRELHWSLGASLPHGDWEQWFGIGTGQYPERYQWSAPDRMMPGSHQLAIEDGDAFLRLGGARQALGFGELYRVSQRVTPALKTPLTVKLRARAPEGGRVHVEVCRKHLLYDDGCSAESVRIAPGDSWSRLDIQLTDKWLGGAGWPPKLTLFSVANSSRGRVVEVDDIHLTDARGQSLLRNGDFSDFSDFWFFSSDRHHLPWHAKNLWLHYFVEHGVFGLVVFSALLFLALYRVTFGSASRLSIAPPLAGGLMAFSAVGAFDSLVDAPRVAILLFLLLFLALGLRPCARLGG